MAINNGLNNFMAALNCFDKTNPIEKKTGQTKQQWNY